MARLQPTRSTSTSNFSGFTETFGPELALSADGSLLAYSRSSVETNFGDGPDSIDEGVVVLGSDGIFGIDCPFGAVSCEYQYVSENDFTRDDETFEFVFSLTDTIRGFEFLDDAVVVGPVEFATFMAPPPFAAPTLSASGTTLAFQRDDQVVVVDLSAQTTATPWIASTAERTSLPLDAGGGGGGTSSSPALSGDGNLVTFVSDAADLLNAAAGAGPGKGKKPRPGNVVGVQILLKDQSTGSLSLVSADQRGRAGNGPSGSPQMSGDGRLVVFDSEAENLVRRDGNGVRDVFVKDLMSGRVTLLSADRRKDPGNGPSGEPSLALEGRLVAFSSTADDLVEGDLNGASDVFVKDVKNGRIRLASVDADGNQLGGSGPSISGDGRYVVFLSDAEGFPTGDGSVTANAFVKDMVTGAIARLDVGATTPVGGAVLRVSLTTVEISADGTTIGFFEGSRGLNVAPDVPDDDAPAVVEAIGRLFEDDPNFNGRETIGVTTNPLRDGGGQASLVLDDQPFDLARLLPCTRGLSGGETEALALQDGGLSHPGLTIDLPLLL